MFFKFFPNRNYIFDRTSVQIPDLFRRVHPTSKFVNSTLLEFHRVRDGEKPEDISFDLYGNVEHYWTILLINDVIDPYKDWLMDYNTLYEYALEKYGSQSRLDDPHHYVHAGTEVRVDYDSAAISAATIVPVTNFEHEISENEKKRDIYVLAKEHVNNFSKQFQKLIREE